MCLVRSYFSLGKTISSKFTKYSIFKNVQLLKLVKLPFIVNYFPRIEIPVLGNFT